MIATEAGRRLYKWLTEPFDEPVMLVDHADTTATIIDIETQAAVQERERILQDARFHHGRLHDGDWELCCTPICYGVQLLALEGWLTSEPKPW